MVPKREVLKNNFYIIWISLEHLLEYRHKPGTIWSFKVIENGDNYSRIFWSFKRGTGNIDVLDKIKRNDLYRLVFAAVEDKKLSSWAYLNVIEVIADINFVF
jgi:hypothetical protein